VAGLVGGGGGGLTPLVFAAREGDIESQAAAGRQRQTSTRRREYGWTPLLTAVNNRNYQWRSCCVDRGANPNLANKGGWTPLYLATDNRNIEGGDYPGAEAGHGSSRVIKVLLEKGAEPERACEGQHADAHRSSRCSGSTRTARTRLSAASQSSDTALMKLLLDYKADPKPSTAQGDNALTAAAWHRWVRRRDLRSGSPKENVEAVRHAAAIWTRPELGEPGRAARR
jgi:ankyrin repeat protein